MTTTMTPSQRVHPPWCTRGVRVNASRTPPLVYAWCTGERQPRTARIGSHTAWPFTRTPSAYTCSDKGKRTGVRETRTPATQKPPLTRGNAYRSPVHPYGADPEGVRPRSACGSLVYATTPPASRMTHPRAGANQ